MKTHVTPATAFVPEGPQLPMDMKDHAFGVRKNTLFKKEGEDQYLVYAQGYDAQNDPDCKHVIGSGFTFSHAIISARMSQALKKIKPEFYWDRLKGCRFGEAVEEGNIALQHVVLDEDGRELGRADTREEAAKLALHRALVGAKDVTFKEFSAIAAPVHVDHSAGRNAYGAVFRDSDAMDAFRGLVRRMFKASPSVQEVSAAMRSGTVYAGRNVSAKEESALALLNACQREALGTLGGAAGATYRLTAEDGAWQAFAVLHTSHISAATAMKIAYEGYRDDLVEVQSSRSVEMPQISA
jgi:hypothetical protein